MGGEIQPTFLNALSITLQTVYSTLLKSNSELSGVIANKDSMLVAH
jgi:hypothetical protein